MDKVEITGIILAGGKSSRMGTDKSLLVWENKTLIEHAVDMLKPICSKVIISANNQVYSFTGCEIWPDERQDQAPIIGIYSCLKRSETNMNFILSCDMPLIGTELIRYLVGSCGDLPLLVAVHEDGLIEPLCGVYNKNIIPDMEKCIQSSNLSLNQFIQDFAPHYLKIGKELPFYKTNMFANINTPDDLEKLVYQRG